VPYFVLVARVISELLMTPLRFSACNEDQRQTRAIGANRSDKGEIRFRIADCIIGDHHRSNLPHNVISRHHKMPVTFVEIHNALRGEIFSRLVQCTQKSEALFIIDLGASCGPRSAE
jgi:hypothetical protein